MPSSDKDVIPLRPCRGCGADSIPVDIAYKGEVIATGRMCSKCVEKMKRDLTKVRPVFNSMIAVGVDRGVANDVMTFLLSKVDIKGLP